MARITQIERLATDLSV